jgi:hypothetical protein
MARFSVPAAMACSLILGSCAAAAEGDNRPPPADAASIARLIADLADDDVPWNAHHAMWRLQEIGTAAEGQLEAALLSHDWQQRQIAAHCLRGLEDYEPSDRLLEVTVEGLRDDDLPAETREGRRVAYTYVFNAKYGMRYLLEHVRRAEPLLLDGLRSDDEQQRFLCAFILGYAGFSSGIPEGAPVLLAQLRDNDITDDAIMGAAALYRFGPEVMPHLLAALSEADDQQARLINLILLDLTDPPQTKQELWARKKLHDVTEIYYDPVVEFDLDRHFVHF